MNVSKKKKVLIGVSELNCCKLTFFAKFSQGNVLGDNISTYPNDHDGMNLKFFHTVL